MAAEPTVRCWKCGTRTPERKTIRRNVRTAWQDDGSVAGRAVYGRVDLCPDCDAVVLANRHKWRLALRAGLALVALLALGLLAYGIASR